LDQPEQVGRIALAISVHRSNDLTAGGGEPVGQSGGFAPLLAQAQQTNARLCLGEGFDQLSRFVGRAIVHGEAFPAAASLKRVRPVESGGQFPQNGADGLGFIAQRDDNAQKGLPRRRIS
jgi:hypothetical protein